MKKKLINISMVGSVGLSKHRKKFDSHVKNLFHFDEVHELCLSCSEFFTQNATFLDVECSTGTLIKKF